MLPSEAAIARINHIINRIESDPRISDEDCDKYLSELEQYECWVSSSRLLEKRITDPKNRSLCDYVRLAKIQIHQFNDGSLAAQTLSHAVADLNLDYDTFTKSVIDEIVDTDDYLNEAEILHSIYPMLSVKSGLVKCLEKLCYIYEKKRYNEALLEECYEKLIAIDPNNVKALRHYKVTFIQNNEWGEAIRVLYSLLANVKYKNDGFRIAQEMAAIYLYQMDLPQKTIEILENHCVSSPLDTSTIHFDAYKRLRDNAGCLRVLKGCLDGVTSNYSRAIIHFKMGELEEQAGNIDRAKACYTKSSNLTPKLFEPLERLIEIHLNEKDWISVLRYLTKIQQISNNQNLTKRLEEACFRIKDGLKKQETS